LRRLEINRKKTENQESPSFIIDDFAASGMPLAKKKSKKATKKSPSFIIDEFAQSGMAMMSWEILPNMVISHAAFTINQWESM
jgi:hypothetical protein